MLTGHDMGDSQQDKHPDGDGSRYASARGWEPKRPPTIGERERSRKAKRARERHARQEAARRAIEVRTLCEWLDEAEPPQPRRDLFPPFWREGELAVLTGPPGVGKSLLAVQLAEAIASAVNSEQRTVNNGGGNSEQRTTNNEKTPSKTAPSLFTIHCSLFTEARSVLLLDLARTPRQIAELYAEHEFPERLEYGLLDDVEMPESYNGRRDRFYLEAIGHRLAESEAPVVIIDNLSWLTRSRSSAEMHALMKTFRRWVNDTGRSMLVLRHSREDLAMYSQPAAIEMADSIFALCRSTMGENIRYIKSLRSPTRLDRSEAPRLTHEGWHPEREPGMTGWFSPNTPFDHQRDVIALRTTNGPFFEFAGVSPEEFHLYDYTAHAKRVNRRLEEITELHSHGLSLVPEKRINFLGITDGKPTESDP